MLATPPSPLKAAISTRLTCPAQPQAQTTKINRLFNAGAQCSPRPACPLKGAHLMQVHDRPQGAPVLALAGDPVSLKRMQNHAPYACMAFLGEKGGIFGNF